jgi:hypothetical protein
VIARCEIRDIEFHLRPSLNSSDSRISRSSADTTSDGLAKRQAKLALQPAMSSDTQSGSATESRLGEMLSERRVHNLRPLTSRKAFNALLSRKQVNSRVVGVGFGSTL